MLSLFPKYEDELCTDTEFAQYLIESVSLPVAMK